MLRNEGSLSEFVHDLTNMEINFTIPFGFLIRGIESKVFSIISANPLKEFDVGIQGQINPEFSNFLIVLPCCEM